jgi:cytochrome c-type biogenesis protein CcmH/NrfG
MTSKTCSNCDGPIKAGDRLCPLCGHPVNGETGTGHSRFRYHLIVLGVLALAAVVYVGYEAMSSRPTSPEPRATRPVQPTGPQDMARFRETLPAEFASLVSMGNALMDQREYILAVECYQKALQQHPESTSVLVDLGVCRHALGQNDEAIAHIKKALEYDPAHQIAKFNLGIIYLVKGDTAEAAAWWNRLLAENPPPDLKTRTEQFLHQIGRP